MKRELDVQVAALPVVAGPGIGVKIRAGRFPLPAMRLTFTMIDIDISPQAQGYERTRVLLNLRLLGE